jgi:acetyltransferase-like isoleucine patch superfamily enzyme
VAQMIDQPPLGEPPPLAAVRQADQRTIVVDQASGVVLLGIAASVREHLSAALKYATNHVVAHMPIPALRHAWYRRVLGWQIQPGATIALGMRLIPAGLRAGRGMVSLGAGAVIEEGCVMQSLDAIHIGARARIGPGALLLTGGHDIEHPEFVLVTAPIVIEQDAYIGPKAIVLGGVTVGHAAVVAPQAVVTKTVPPFAIVAGAPARVVGTHTPGIAQQTSSLAS